MNQNSDCPFAPGTCLAVYLRHPPGEDQTITSQRSIVQRWCAEHDLSIVEEFVDEAKSGASTSGREDFTRMIEWLQYSERDHPVSSVVVWSFSRFGRNYNDVPYYKSLLRRIGIEVFSMTEAIPRESVGHVIEALHNW
jgi:site-specific DNA recombinase